ncbi:MAG: WhiB family transcriptional regulator, partial [Acidimicrobiia bacterium]
MTPTATATDPRSHWADAACLGTNPELFYPARGESTAAAKAVCSTCPV